MILQLCWERGIITHMAHIKVMFELKNTWGRDAGRHILAHAVGHGMDSAIRTFATWALL